MLKIRSKLFFPLVIVANKLDKWSTFIRFVLCRHFSCSRLWRLPGRSTVSIISFKCTVTTSVLLWPVHPAYKLGSHSGFFFFNYFLIFYWDRVSSLWSWLSWNLVDRPSWLLTPIIRVPVVLRTWVLIASTHIRCRLYAVCMHIHALT